jgi:trehalose 6-phosphate phosphatase
VVGNHGAEVVSPDGVVEIHPEVAAFGHAVAAAHAELASELRPLPGVLVEDKRWSLSIHTRLADRAAVPTVREAVERAARAHGLRVLPGKEIYELRAPVGVHKGTAVWSLAERLGATGRDASVMFAGDDVTDEDAFLLLRERAAHALTIRVSAVPASSAAEFAVPDTEAVRQVIEQLVGLRA